jgi:hypothetical protein
VSLDDGGKSGGTFACLGVGPEGLFAILLDCSPPVTDVVMPCLAVDAPAVLCACSEPCARFFLISFEVVGGIAFDVVGFCCEENEGTAAVDLTVGSREEEEEDEGILDSPGLRSSPLPPGEGLYCNL